MMKYDVVKLMEEHKLIPLMQAAQYKDPTIFGEMDEEERACYDHYVEWFDELRKQNGGTLKGLDIDIPYSY